MGYTIHVIRQAHLPTNHRKEPAMTRITIANQSVICNDYTVIESSCEYNCVSYDLDTDEDYYYDCHVYYAC